ncbi:MAG: biotin--[acetyl-CoA-carboxylase] ligase [Verrucomicrobiales bacterium]
MMRWEDLEVPSPWRLEVVDQLDSTNEELKRRADLQHGEVLLAKRQTAGKGRRGAAWHAVPGESLTFSAVVRPAVPRMSWSRLALAAGVAVAEALEEIRLRPQIKWPNDVLIHGRKICGILVEATPEVAIVGIGVNLGNQGFRDELDGVATSVFLENGEEVDSAEFLVALLASLHRWSDEIGEGFPSLLEQVRMRCALTGRRVSLKTVDGGQQGVVEGISDRGELLLETLTGRHAYLQADEVRVVGP